MHFLAIAAKQADLWVDSVKSGKPFELKTPPQLAREKAGNTAVKALHPLQPAILKEFSRTTAENFVGTQKALLDVMNTVDNLPGPLRSGNRLIANSN